MAKHKSPTSNTAEITVKHQEIGAFPDRLRQVIGGRSVRSFARHCGISDSVLRQYLRGKSEPTRPVLLAISCCTGVAVEWLATGTGPSKTSGNRATLQLADGDFCSLPPLVPHRSDVDVTPGGRMPSNIIFRAEWLKKELSADPQALSITLARGNAMEPVISDGDKLLVNIGQNRIDKDGIYLLQVNGSAIPRRVQVLMDGGLRIACDNPAYTPQTISQSDAGSLKVIGRVVWIGKKLQ